MNRSAKYATAIVVAHLLVNIVHGLANRELRVGLAPLDSIVVIVVVLLFPLIARGLLWTAKKRPGFILLSLSLFGYCYSVCTIIFWLLAQITSIRSLRARGGSPLS